MFAQLCLFRSALLLLSVTAALSQRVGTVTQYSDYVSYSKGTLNLILVAPHGGLEMPDTIQNRTAGCYDNATKVCTFRHNCVADYANCPVTIEHDSYTIEAATQIRDHIYNLTGKYPYLIMNKLHRVKLDPNREVNEAAFGEPLAVAAFETYHNYVTLSTQEILGSSNYRVVLVLDVHGQSHPHNLTELGYNLTVTELDTDTYDLSQTSTVRHAAKQMSNSHDLIKGDVSFGHYMEVQQIRCLPSPNNPTIGGRDYFNGGYTTQTHSTNVSDAIQLEIARNVRFEPNQFNANMLKLARGITYFHEYHYGIRTSGAGSLAASLSLLLCLALLSRSLSK